MMRTSSAKRRWRILIVLETFIPKIFLAACPLFRRRVKDSMAKTKRRGERIQPWRNPLPLRKKEEGSPFIKMANFSLTTQLIIHLINWLLKPIWTKINLSKYYSMQSKAFLSSTFKTSALDVLDLILWRHSWAVPIVSRIFRPFRKPRWFMEMYRERRGFILEVMIF